MFLTATLSQGLLNLVAHDCNLSHYENRVWPLCAYTVKGPGYGVLIPNSCVESEVPVLTIGVFQLRQGFELVWKESTANFQLQSCIGVGGHLLKKAIALREIEKFSKENGLYRHSMRVSRDGSITIILRSLENGC